jgi:hypothetical protein
MAKDKITMKVNEQSPLKWPKGWLRTGIEARRAKKVWNKPLNYCREALIRELGKAGVTELIISFNTGEDARRDPGVSIFFWKQAKQDFSWQLALGIDNPAPTLDEIDSAYRKKSLEHHPDRLGDKATAADLEIFKALGKHRENARQWVLNSARQDRPYELPCDRFSEVRWNINALRFGIVSLRRLEEYGLPGLLERVAQPGLLSEHSEVGEDGKQTVNA